MNTATHADVTHQRPDPFVTKAALQRHKFAPNLPTSESDVNSTDRAAGETRVFKDAMIHEVHHRTKNTLQVAASLLSLHARTTSSAEVREALQDSQRRLQVLACAHELLYSNPSSRQLILMPNLLQRLGDALGQSLSAQVRLELTSDAIALPADIAIPMALLANEAITNAYKHAFPNDAPGKVTVQLRRTPENGLLLQIADSGIGMQRNSREGGMGLKLIRTFAAQLQGVLDFAEQTDTTGTVITLTIARHRAD